MDKSLGLSMLAGLFLGITLAFFYHVPGLT